MQDPTTLNDLRRALAAGEKGLIPVELTDVELLSLASE
jgi:hypothetical protein